MLTFEFEYEGRFYHVRVWHEGDQPYSIDVCLYIWRDITTYPIDVQAAIVGYTKQHLEEERIQHGNTKEEENAEKEIGTEEKVSG